MKKLKELVCNFNVLYVEDEKASREQVGSIFKLLFHSLDIAFDGEDALQKYQPKRYDIVITDINMPRMDGIELIKRIKSQNPSQNIIIISAHNNSDYLLQAINLGIDNFIIKPIQIEQLSLVLTKIAQLIHAEKISKQYQQELEKELKEKTTILSNQLITDELTGLPNRNALLKLANTNNNIRTMLLISIDNFDNINITYGYDNSDILIQKIAHFLKSKMLKETKLYKVNSNEFAIVSFEKSLKEMNVFAHFLQQNVEEHTIKFNNISTKVSITIAITEGVDCLLKNAHIALKEAQEMGQNRINIYKKNSSIERLQLKIQEYMPRLRKVIAKKHIVPYFQPIVNNKTKKIEKYECLARIINDKGEIEVPLNFIDIAEMTGMIPDITRIMIDKSFQIFQNNDLEFSINISEYDLNDGYLQEYLQKKLLEYNINTSRVILEVLEGISAIGAKRSLEQLLNLKADGFGIAIDDFGVQNSNFERVHSMQVDYIKIDGSFIKNIYNNPKSYMIAKTISEFGKSIGAKIIAEYVHSKEVQDIVIDLDIEYSQGYYFSPPQKTLLKN
ncbi:EAL domain-containing protein [Sulfurimonas sp.]|uniref:EAL domain-containing protein n=1 Tax=Sulfurimonas sp. TaxID=2022749 RepID=UPI002601A352|nr:EAL domain-containing response regulator [Sulfurimonas sp.]